jgi:hypothetical protein
MSSASLRSATPSRGVARPAVYAAVAFAIVTATFVASTATGGWRQAGRWIALGWNAWGYPVAEPALRTAVVVDGPVAYLAAGMDGIEVLSLVSAGGTAVGAVALPADFDRVDDLALADRLLFALDATPPGHLAVYSLADPFHPRAVAAAVPVDVGPFSGVAAARGLVVVSGGTSLLTLRAYDASGVLSPVLASGDYGRGQPDVAWAMDVNGAPRAAVSTHIVGPDFALQLIEARINTNGVELLPREAIARPRAGFTAGGFKPAHFPLVAAWRGDRLWIADASGLTAVDTGGTAAPRLLAEAHEVAPAIDLALAVDGSTVDVLRGGPKPAVMRYRFDVTTSELSPSVVWEPPPGTRPHAIARAGEDVVFTGDRGWRVVRAAEFQPVRDAVAGGSRP